MAARIMMDALVRPVIGDTWHQTNVSRHPAQGEPITTLCGITDTVDYSETGEVMAVPCWVCDRRYRESYGLPVPARHPTERTVPRGAQTAVRASAPPPRSPGARTASHFIRPLAT